MLSVRQLFWRAIGINRLIRDPLHRAEQKRTAGLEIAVAIVGGVVGAVTWQLAWILLLSNTLPWGAFVLGMLIAPLIPALLAWLALLGYIRRRRGDRIIEIYLTAGRCPACGYLLENLPTHADGCMVCPECEAAWRAERVGTPAQ